jgi:hypothetical protein
MVLPAGGFALFFRYSTWHGAGLYLEDLFVRISPARHWHCFRAWPMKQKRKKRLFVRWTVLDWNASAVGLYKTLGAEFLDDWRTVPLTGDGFKNLMKRDC